MSFNTKNGIRVYSGFGSFGARFGNPPAGREFNGHEGDKESEEDKDAGTNCKQSVAVVKANPINIATGNKLEPELDFAAQGEMPLYLQRTYNRHWYGIGLFGWFWLSNFDYRLSFFSSYPSGEGVCYARPSIAECTNTGGAAEVWAHRPDGRKVKYVKAPDGIFYEDKASPVAKIVRQANGTWVLYGEENQTETYSVGGYPLTILNEAGIGWTFSYGGLQNTQPQRVTHTSGRFVEFVWVDDELREVRDPAGHTYQFSYGGPSVMAEVGSHLLKTTTSPGTPATVITYHYEPEYGFNSLTGKSYNGVRYSTFKYDMTYRAISSEHAGGVEKYSFIYTSKPDGIMTVAETNPLGKQATYVFKDGKAQNVTGLPSNSCAGAYKEIQYDANGYEDLVADFNGNFTNYDYNAKGQLLKQVEAFGTPVARTTTYVWDDTRNRISRVTVEGVAQTDYTYTTGNRVASVAVTNLSPNGVQGQVRTTRYAYTVHPNGLLATATIDGPLPEDTLTYTYNVTGDLTEVRNSLGHATTYSNYNAMGQAGRVAGANGEVTDFEYDARNRIAAVKPIIGGVSQPTNYTYDGFGRVASIQTPDGRTRITEYDDAWRVTREYEREAGGTYAVNRYTYNNLSQVTSVVTERTTAIVPPVATPAITVPTYGLGGNYTVGWSAVGNTEAYVLEESASGGAWSTAYSGAALNKAFSGKPVGSYSYRVKACNAAGCTPVSGTGNVQVIYKPASAPALSVPGQSTAGSYTVSWTSVATATSYKLEESINGGAWTFFPDTTTTSKSITGKSAGTYGYRVAACNVAGCGPTSASASVQEIDPPTSAPTVSAPSVNTTGSYTVSWTGVATATSYQLEENLNGGAWTLIFNGAATSKALSGKAGGNFGYRVKACNAAGCGPTSGSITVQQPVYGAQFIAQSVPTSIQSGQSIVVSVQMKNTGNMTWTAGDAYRLGSQNPQDNTLWGLNRVAVPGTVAPGQIGTFSFSITGPYASRSWYKTFQWRMVRDGVTWFGDLTPSTEIWLVVPDESEPDPDPCAGSVYNCEEP